MFTRLYMLLGWHLNILYNLFYLSLDKMYVQGQGKQLR